MARNRAVRIIIVLTVLLAVTAIVYHLLHLQGIIPIIITTVIGFGLGYVGGLTD